MVNILFLSEAFVGVANQPNLAVPEVFRDSERPDSHIVACSMNGNSVKRRIYDPLQEGDDVKPINSLVGMSDAHLGLTQLHKFHRDRQERLKSENIRLHEDIMNLLVRLAQVRCSLVHADEEISSITASISPIHLLPGEILESIFFEAVSRDSGDWPDVTSSSPIRIAQVCSDWRQIALQQPRLWTRFRYNMKWASHYSPTFSPVHTPVQAKGSEASGGQLSLLKLWFQRSSPLPLSISISISISDPRPFHPRSDSTNNAHPNHRSLFQSYGSRIEHLHLNTNSTNAFAYLGIPNLIGLKRVKLDLIRCEFHNAPINDFMDLPHLTDLTYSLRSGNPFLFPVRWEIITLFDLGDSARAISILHWKYFVRCCPNLERGRFNIGGLPGDTDGIPVDVISTVNPHAEFSLPKLKELTLLLGDSVSLSALLENTHTHRLEVLDLRAQGPLSDDTLASWRPVFQQLRFSLRHLNVSCSYVRDLGWLKICIGELVNLTSLKLKLQNDKKVLQMLAMDDAPVLPNLQTLGIWISALSKSERQCFWEMVRSRCSVVVEGGRRDSALFMVDVFVDKTKLYSDNVHVTLWDQEYSQVHHCVRIHVKSPYASL